MSQTISIGKQDFVSLREHNYFYIDKSLLIKEWWESGDEITLITRPRRFGKTLNMSMLESFFSIKYKHQRDIFKGLEIWKYEQYQEIHGTYPVIFVSFATVKADNYIDARNQVIDAINEAYLAHTELLDTEVLTESEKMLFKELDIYVKNTSIDKTISNDIVCASLRTLAYCLQRCYEKKVIILLDEYDTPMQEAYVNGYWDEFISFIRSLFNATFKTNPYMERALMTGITRVSKESVFSDLNNLTVISSTTDRYAEYFGFMEDEVFNALEEYGLADCKEEVKNWYDGFIFGEKRDIYNPWSITNYLKERQIRPYWASTSSNNLISTLLKHAGSSVKSCMEQLIDGKEIVVNFDEQIVFEQLDQDEHALWSLLLASGYLKAEKIEHRGILLEPWYHLKITNLETLSMFCAMFKGWFLSASSKYNSFVEALLKGNVKEMNLYMNDIALATFSSFDTAERFYHGFVLGLLVELRDLYEIRSNRESGYGRYDVMLIPNDTSKDAIIMEFKVLDDESEKKLSDTVEAAKRQIEDKAYDTELLELGFSRTQIKHYGFAFSGKKVLIG